jgi:hypothetical protein
MILTFKTTDELRAFVQTNKQVFILHWVPTWLKNEGEIDKYALGVKDGTKSMLEKVASCNPGVKFAEIALDTGEDYAFYHGFIAKPLSASTIVVYEKGRLKDSFGCMNVHRSDAPKFKQQFGMTYYCFKEGHPSYSHGVNSFCKHYGLKSPESTNHNSVKKQTTFDEKTTSNQVGTNMR